MRFVLAFKTGAVEFEIPEAHLKRHPETMLSVMTRPRWTGSEGAPEVQRIEVPDVAGGFGDFGAAQREAGRKRAEALRNRAGSPNREKEEMKPAPADSSEVASGAVYDELRAKREAQRAAMEAREEQRKFNRLTPAEQAKYRAAGKAPKGK